MKTVSLILAMSMLSTIARADINYIISSHDNDCAQSGIGCALGSENVFTSSGQSTQMTYQATFTVAYKFTCTPTGAASQSRISVVSTDQQGSRKFVSYDTTDTFKVDGTGPLRIEDQDPRELADNYQPPGCLLNVAVTGIAPSAWQISDWASARAAIMTDLDDIRSFYNSRPTLAFWRQEYSARPDQFRGLIEKTIADLQATLSGSCGDTDDGGDFGDFVTCQLIDSYSDILNNAPDTAIDTLFAEVKNAAGSIIQRGRTLVANKKAAGISDQELSDKLDSVSNLMGP